MVIRYPSYYEKFTCIAAECKDNCCIGWEIDIDERTNKYYQNINGDFGKRLKKSINTDDEPCFILGENERCPFLNKNNLCDIILNLGENKLCDICTRHPRFFNEYGNLREIGVGLCCESACKLILTSNENFSLITTQNDEDNDEELSDVDFFDLIYSSRNDIFEILKNDGLSVEKRLIETLKYAYEIEEDYDLYLEKNVNNINIINQCHKIFNFYKGLEQLDKKWIDILNSADKNIQNILNNRQAFTNYYGDRNSQFKNLAEYFVYRYFIKANDDYNILSKIILTALSVFIIKALAIDEWLQNGRFNVENLIQIAKMYSKEIEYSAENLDSFENASYEKEEFNIQNIIAMFSE